jgi:hypothetical protein
MPATAANMGGGAHFRFGSKADIVKRLDDVRFNPLCATSGLMRRSKIIGSLWQTLTNFRHGLARAVGLRHIVITAAARGADQIWAPFLTAVVASFQITFL